LFKLCDPTPNEERGAWKKLHNEELHNLYASPSIIRTIKSRRMRLAGHVVRMWKKRNVYRILVGKPEGKRPQGRPRCRWVGKGKVKFSPLQALEALRVVRG
jgi:hypothetical protein